MDRFSEYWYHRQNGNVEINYSSKRASAKRSGYITHSSEELSAEEVSRRRDSWRRSTDVLMVSSLENPRGFSSSPGGIANRGGNGPLNPAHGNRLHSNPVHGRAGEGGGNESREWDSIRKIRRCDCQRNAPGPENGSENTDRTWMEGSIS